MLKEPTITWVPSGFTGYIWLDTKIVLKTEIDLANDLVGLTEFPVAYLFRISKGEGQMFAGH